MEMVLAIYINYVICFELSDWYYIIYLLGKIGGGSGDSGGDSW